MTDAEHAQYIADQIDATILTKHLHPELDEDQRHEAAQTLLATEGYGGRRYTFAPRPGGKLWWPISVTDARPLEPS